MKNRRKYVLLSLGLVACLGIGFGAFLWLSAPRIRINEASVAKIKAGMNLAEVEEIIGGPPRDYGPGEDVAPSLLASCTRYSFPSYTIWSSGDLAIWVTLTNEGRVNGAELRHTFRPKQGILDKLRSWLLLPWF